MHDFMLKLFLRDKNFKYDRSNRLKIGNVASIIGIISNFMLFIIKYLVGVLTFSVAVTADSFNNLFDSLSSLIALVGFKVSALPADNEHPYGHARFENISDLFVGLVIIGVGFSFVVTSVETIIKGSDILMTPLTIALLIFTLVVKMWQASFNFYVGKKIDSQLLITTGHDSVNDCLINILVLIGLAIESIFSLKIDGVIGLLLAVYILLSGLHAVFETIQELMGKRVSDNTLTSMFEQLETYEDILSYHDLVVHNYGPQKIFATVDVEIDASFDLLKAHDIAEKIQNDFKNLLDVNLVVHIDPVLLNDPEQRAYFKKVKELIKTYNQKFSIHDFRLIRHKGHNIIQFDIVVYDCEKISDKDLMREFEDLILSVYTEDELRITIDRNYLELNKNEEH